MLRWAGFVLLILMLLGTGYIGITDAMDGIRQARSTAEWTVAVSQLSYGVLGVLALVAMGARHAVATQLIYGWCVAMILTAGMAPVVYGKQSVGIGIVAGLGTVLFLVIPIAIWRNRPAGVNG